MKLIILIFLFLLSTSFSQDFNGFERTVLPPSFDSPWSIDLADDEFLYLFEYPATIVRIHPEIGQKEILYKFEDLYYPDEREDQPLCGHPKHGGHRGLALHPDFINPDSSFMFVIYSYNYGTSDEPDTKFKLVRLKWNEATKEMVEDTILNDTIPSGYDHSGGRIISTKENGETYLYYSVGDLSPTEFDCYENPDDDPKNTAKDPNYMNGKIHRVLIDGTVPVDNPIPGNSMWTRGHRNPQGLTHNPESGQIYSVEHGATTDDEVNYLEKGMNYGWQKVQGYHDANREGEQEYIDNYQPHPLIENDKLVEPMHSWCLDYTTDVWFLACTVAPSGMAYYNSDAIPGWKNSLLVTTLKSANFTTLGVWRLKLSDDGKTVLDSTSGNPNPVLLFTEDQKMNGRLREIEISKDGKSLYLINNGGEPEHQRKIIVYTYKTTKSVFDDIDNPIYPNPATDVLNFGFDNLQKVTISDLAGRQLLNLEKPQASISISHLIKGVYFAEISHRGETKVFKFIKK